MSKIALTPNASGTGTLTIAAPNTSTDRTITLPDETGSIITTGSSGKVIPAAALPAGSVLQVVQTVKTNTATHSGGTYASVGLDVTITPSSTSNKILIVTSFAFGSNTGSANIDMRIYNSTTSTAVSTDPYFTDRWPTDSQSAYYCHNINFTHLDSPNTTSATSYSIQFKTNAGAITINMPSNTGGFSNPLVSTITAMEIAA